MSLHFSMSIHDLVNMMEFVTFDKHHMLGRGLSGTVYAGVRRASKGSGQSWPELNVAVKLIDHKHCSEQDVLEEVDISCRVRHPACLPIIAYSPSHEGGSILVTERMACDLDTVIQKERTGSAPREWENTTKSIVALGIAAGLNYLHSKEIVHRDIRPANILLDSDFHPHIAGFGARSEGGAPLFIAPEVINGEEGSYPSDVYAYAMLLYILVSGSYPFPGMNPIQLSMRISKGDRPAIPGHVPSNYKDLITRCWSASPSDRPTFAQIIANPDALKLEPCDDGAIDEYKVDVLNLK